MARFVAEVEEAIIVLCQEHHFLGSSWMKWVKFCAKKSHEMRDDFDDFFA